MSDILNRFMERHHEGGPVDANKKVKIGIIGTGWIAEAHIVNYLKQPDVEIVAGADLIPGKAEAFFERFGVKGVHLYNRPQGDAGQRARSGRRQHLHLQLPARALRHLRAGEGRQRPAGEAHVRHHWTKPWPSARRRRRAARSLSIGFQPRLDANMQMIKKIVESGELGKIYYIQTGGGRRRGIPSPTVHLHREGDRRHRRSGRHRLLLAGHGAQRHRLSQAADRHRLHVQLLRHRSHEAYVPAGHPEYAAKFGVDDFAAAFIRLEGGIILDFRIAWAMNIDTTGDTIILGTKGGLRIPSTDCWNGTVGGPMTLYHEVAGEQTQTIIPIIKDDGNLFDRKIRSFLDAVKTGGKAPVPSEQIIYNQAILDGILKSSECGHEVMIEIPEE